MAARTEDTKLKPKTIFDLSNASPTVTYIYTRNRKANLSTRYEHEHTTN